MGAHGFREHLGLYLERAAAGETFLVTRRGKPVARLMPPQEQLLAPEPAKLELVG